MNHQSTFAGRRTPLLWSTVRCLLCALACSGVAAGCNAAHGSRRDPTGAQGSVARLPPVDLPHRPERPAVPPAPAAPVPGRPMAVEDPSGASLETFLAGLRALEAGTAQRSVHVLHYGDSHVAADLYSHELRRSLQARFGDGGPGFVAVGKPWRSYRHGALELGSEGPWTVQKGRLGSDEPGTRPLGLAGVAMRAADADTVAWLRAPGDAGPDAGFDSVEVHFLRGRGAGSFDLSVDGRQLATVATDRAGAGQPAFGAQRYELAAPGRRLSVRPRGDGAATLLGLVVERAKPGVVYDTLGINGAQAGTPLLWDPDVFGAALRQRDPDLVLLAYGANEAGLPRLSPMRYQRTFTQLVERVRRAVPRASCLIVAPCDRAAAEGGGEWRTLPTILDVVAVQREVAAQQGCAFWNAFGAMGGRGAIQRWATWDPAMAQEDRVHLTRAGYSRLASLLGEALLRSYEASSSPGH